MQKTLASFALATLSLLTSYAIVAAWPGKPAGEPVATDVAPIAIPLKPTVVSSAE